MTEKDNTIVTRVEISPSELNELLDIPGADSVMLPEEKPSIFSNKRPDLSFINQKETPKKVEPVIEKETPIDDMGILEPPKETPPKEVQGRPKLNKDAAVELAKKLIEKGTIVPFDDDKPLEEYTTADFEELFEANLRDKEEKIKAQTPVEFFDSLPQELQYAAKYVADGGTDLKGLFKALSDVEAVRGLSTTDPEDHETIIKEYLRVTQFGTDEDIDEEITSWKDLGKLEEKAAKFKPKLDAMRQEQVTYRLAQQEEARKQSAEAARNYAGSIYEVLKPGEVNGLKIDKKTQGMLYSGLVQPQYPSISGKPTNLLGHLLEKYQFVEPNHGLITEVLWHLADPEGFKARVKELGANDTTEKIVRKLRTEESRKIGSSPVIEKEETRVRTIPRNNNFFKR